ncbi:MAG: bifunctional YncE family protein/alkaline phosphatase family protein [Phycisphaerales bacterium JB038]
MITALLLSVSLLAVPQAADTSAAAPPLVGPGPEGTLTPSAQLLRPEGASIEFSGRPVDIALSPGGDWLYAKDNRGVLVVDCKSWQITQTINSGGGSMIGLAVSPEGDRVYATTSGDEMVEFSVTEEGTLSIERRIKLPGPGGKGRSFPCGVVLNETGDRAFVCLSVNNTLAEVGLGGDRARVLREIPVGVAPFDVKLTPDGKTAVVSDWGGRRAAEGEETAPSAGTETLVDERGIAASGGVSIVDLAADPDEGEAVHFIYTGRSASGVAISPDGALAYIANANDDTVSVVNVKEARPVRQIVVKPDLALPFGSMPNALTLIEEGRRLLVALAGNNAIAVVDLTDEDTPVVGLIPTGWYPGGVIAHEGELYIANIKGVGSRTPRGNRPGFNSHGHRGTLQKLVLPNARRLQRLTARAKEDARVPQALKALERAQKAEETTPVPVPARPGEPSVIEHCVYIIKENRTYDQVFGDMDRGNSEASLCIYGREITPNQHALADEFGLLDNYYCGGVLSADGHSWATEGNVTPYLERSFGGFARSYTFGDDPLTYSSSGFIWDAVLAAGLSFRNYGEFDYTYEKPNSRFPEIWADWKEAREAEPDGTKPGAIRYEHNIGIANLRRYSNPDSPGWNMDIPDQIRADVFLSELKKFEARGEFPNLVIIYLPNDHTSGTAEGCPTPRALVADNDLAVGRIVEGLSHSSFWPRMAIFINEDDPQDGFDHVDGHRSTCLVVSPWSRQKERVISDFYVQSSVVHTIWRILGITAQNQTAALAPLLTTCFTDEPDLRPFDALPNNISLVEMNPSKTALGPAERRLAELSEGLALDKPDQADEDTLNRILWHAARGIEARYPKHFAGAHGSGLAALGLRFAESGEVEEFDDDDDD